MIKTTRIAIIIAETIIFAACNQFSNQSTPIIRATVEPPTSTPALMALSTGITPTHPHRTETPIPAPPTPQRPESFTAGGPYSTAQIEAIQSGAFIRQENTLKEYYLYWLMAANCPIFLLPVGQQLNIEYLFDPDNPNQACLAIPATGYENVDVLAVPYRSGEPQSVAPAQYVNGQIETGQGPLLLTKSGQSSETGQPYVLSCENGFWVRRDAAGAVMERINQQNQWEVDAGWLVARHNLNPDHQYSIVTVTNEDGTDARYLRDEHNQAYMRKYQAPQPGENPAEVERWVDTSLEEKYGHLVPPAARSFVDQIYVNYFASDVEPNGNPEFTCTMTAAWSTGNSRSERVYYPGVGRDMIHVITSMVYRDQSGNLQPLETIQIIDTNDSQILFMGCADAAFGDDASSATMCDGGWWGYIDSVERLVEAYSLPGLLMQVEFDTVKPETPPPDTAWSLEIAHYALWLEYRQSSQALSDSLLRGTGVNPYPEAPVVISRTYSYMSWEQYSSFASFPTP